MSEPLPGWLIRPYRASDHDAVIALWKACGLVVPWNDPARDIARKVRVQPEWFLVGEKDGAPVATAMFGYDGHRGWVNYVAVHPDRQGLGLGRRIMARVEEILLEQGCPKINLQVRRTNLGALEFYRRLGFDIDDVTQMGKRLIRDDV